MALSKPTKAVILGDSYINRLETFVLSGCPKSIMATKDMRIRFAGKPGGTVQSMQSDLIPQVLVFKPDIVFFHIGANDLSNSLMTPNKIAVHIISLAQYLLTVVESVQFVVIGGLIRRTRRNTKYFSPDLTLEDYNKKIIQTNVVLRTRIDASDFSQRIKFWAHRGFSKEVDWLAKMGPDGAHLNETGMKKFTCSIKTALKQCTYDLV